MTLLDPRFVTRLEALQLSTRRRLAGLFPGEHRSPRYGDSPDFADYRTYHPGDDFRRIDYNLYARLGVLAVRLFEASDETHLRLLVDTSGSMGMWGKLDQAKRVAAALGFVALVNRDPVTVHTFPLDRPAPRFVGRSAAAGMFAHLESLQPEGHTRFADAASAMLARPGPRGVTVVISDLLTPEWEAGLRRLPARGGEVVVVHLLARAELDPDLLGDLDLVDIEDGARLQVSLSADGVADYRRAAAEWAEHVTGLCHRSGMTYVRLLADDDLEQRLLGAWRHAGVLQ